MATHEYPGSNTHPSNTAYPGIYDGGSDSTYGTYPDLTQTGDALAQWIKMKRSGRERPSALWGSSPSLWDSH